LDKPDSQPVMPVTGGMPEFVTALGKSLFEFRTSERFGGKDAGQPIAAFPSSSALGFHNRGLIAGNLKRRSVSDENLARVSTHACRFSDVPMIMIPSRIRRAHEIRTRFDSLLN